MGDFQVLFNVCLQILKIPITLYGFTISLWEILIFGVVGFFLLYLIYRMFD